MHWEFLLNLSQKKSLDKNPIRGLEGYGTYNMPPGTWSDDSSMTIATMSSIVNRQGIDYDDIMSEFLQWLENGNYTQYNHVFDIGNTTLAGLKNYKKGIDPVLCGGDEVRDNGNGSLLRILPLAFVPDITYDVIENVSALTHRHAVSKIACVFYVEIARSMLSNDLSIDEHVNSVAGKIKEYYKDFEELEYFNNIFNDNLDDVKSGGYVIDTFESVVHCLKNTGNYRDAVLKAVNLGEDTDTVAAICGGLAGIYYGFDDIPSEWIDGVPELDRVMKICESYCEYCYEH